MRMLWSSCPAGLSLSASFTCTTLKHHRLQRCFCYSYSSISAVLDCPRAVCRLPASLGPLLSKFTGVPWQLRFFSVPSALQLWSAYPDGRTKMTIFSAAVLMALHGLSERPFFRNVVLDVIVALALVDVVQDHLLASPDVDVRQFLTLAVHYNKVWDGTQSIHCSRPRVEGALMASMIRSELANNMML